MIKRTVAVSSLAAAVAALGACAAETKTTPETRAPAAAVVGEPVSCIQTNTIRDTQVHDDHTIDFQMTNGRIYRNTLPYGCSGIGFERRFAYESTLGRLCSTDTITVLRSGGIHGPTCGLGEFVPVQLTGR